MWMVLPLQVVFGFRKYISMNLHKQRFLNGNKTLAKLLAVSCWESHKNCDPEEQKLFTRRSTTNCS